MMMMNKLIRFERLLKCAWTPLGNGFLNDLIADGSNYVHRLTYCRRFYCRSILKNSCGSTEDDAAQAVNDERALKPLASDDQNERRLGRRARRRDSSGVLPSEKTWKEAGVASGRCEDEVDLYDLSERKVDGVATHFPRAFNLAAYVNRSETLQQFLRMGVDLSRWDRQGDVPAFVLKLDFERDVQPYVRFLHDVGVPADKLGRFFTKNPLILQQNLGDLQVRINYLQSKKFSAASIARIISENPHHIQRDTVAVDRRLGFLQREFGLTGDEVRYVTTRIPKLTTWNLDTFKSNQFSLKEECGFEPNELKHLLLARPRLYITENKSLVERFDYIHNKMGLSHELILHFPGALSRRLFSLKQRHRYLEALGKAQYDPKKPNYVSLKAFVSGNDDDFCLNVAKTPVDKFSDFLKTL